MSKKRLVLTLLPVAALGMWMAVRGARGGMRGRVTAMSERMQQRRSLPGRVLEALESLEAIRENTQRIVQLLEERPRAGWAEE